MKAYYQTNDETLIQVALSSGPDVDQPAKELEVYKVILTIEQDKEEACFIRSSN